MTVKYLKHGKPDVERAEDDAKTRQIVEATLAREANEHDTKMASNFNQRTLRNWNQNMNGK